MSVDNPKSELYRDFVQLVDKVSSTIIKESIVPISGLMTTASLVMKRAASDIGTVADAINKNGSKIDSLASQVKKTSADIEAQIELISDEILKKIDSDIKMSLNKNFDLVQKEFCDLKTKNKNFELQVEIFQKKQEKFFYWIIGLNIFFGLAVLAALYYVNFGMK